MPKRWCFIFDSRARRSPDLATKLSIQRIETLVESVEVQPHRGVHAADRPRLRSQ